MDIFNFFATLLGIVLVAVPLSLLLSQKMTRELFLMAERETTIYIKGIVDLALGVIVLLLTGNVWAHSWQTVITVIAWLLVIDGIVMLFWTGKAAAWGRKMQNAAWVSYALFVAVLVGLALVYLGFAG